jgi:hypothetical protein
LFACKPPDNLNNRCSSNSDNGSFSGKEDGRWSGDTGLRNNVAWSAQFANASGIAAQNYHPPPQGGALPFRNIAVTGSRPEDWVAGGKFNSEMESAIVSPNWAMNTADLTVLTLGANPLLGDVLTGKLHGGCGSGVRQEPAKETVKEAESCMRTKMKDVALYDRLRAIYRRLLDAPQNNVVVMLYPLSYPGLPFYSTTAPAVNFFQPYVAERFAQLVNGEIERAVTDEADAARKAGKGNRLFLVKPPRFNLGLRSLDQAINGEGDHDCYTIRTRVDGPSNQSKALQDAKTSGDTGGDPCRNKDVSKIYLESLDGAHLSRAGHSLYKDLLAAKVKDIGLPLPKP